MKLRKILLPAVALFLLIAAISGVFVLNHIKTAALPDYSESIGIPGLTEEVTVFRDSFAIPHIYAENEADLYRAVGFAMAQDRLWQMDLMRRITQGRLSEILGEGQLDTDLLMRSLRIQEKSVTLLDQSDPKIIEALEAFSAGVNFFIENHPLPFEFKVLGYKPEPWEPVHSVNLIGYLSWDLTSGWRTEMLLYQLGREVSSNYISELTPDWKNHNIPVFPGFDISGLKVGKTLLSATMNLQELGVEVFHGSNNWAVSGKKSKTGKPLLANDMHLGLFSPGIWYQMHHVAEGSLNVTGVVLPGQPFIVCGHNDSIAWGMTNVAVDDLDFYAETLNRDSAKYLFDGQWNDLLVKEELIHIKGKKPVREILKFTHRGPLVNRFKNEDETAISMRWIGNEMSNELRSVYLLNRANNFQDFRTAVKTFRSISQNVIYADVSGNIGLQTCAGIPIREGSGIRVFPGDTSRFDWKGFVPFEELPFEFNPARGYVSSANNKTVPEDYPYYVGAWFAMPDRIGRIREMLEETELHDTDSFAEMLNDYKSKKAEMFVPAFLAALESGTAWNETQKSAWRKLQEWNLVMSRESQAAAVFEVLFRKTAENLIKDELTGDMFNSLLGERILLENLMANVLLNEHSPWMDDRNTPEKETWNDIVIRSFQETVNELEEKLGPRVEDWNWGKLHTLTLNHPLGAKKILDRMFRLSRGPYDVPGSYHTATPYSYLYTSLYRVNHGASHRHIFDLADWDASKTVIPTGTSGIPSCEFYMDQTKLYLNNQYHDDLFSRRKILRDTRFTQILLPGNN